MTPVDAAGPVPAPWRVWTVPNALSAARLAGIPVFLWLALRLHADGWAVWLLIGSSATDYLDGTLARRLGQHSRLGQLLDPLADRLYIAATLLTLVLRHGLPWWWAAGLVGRDLLLASLLPVLRRHGYGPLPVHFLGKAATFNLLWAFPMLLVAIPSRHGVLTSFFRPLGWAFTAWGSALYAVAGLLYLVQVRQLVRADRLAAGGSA